MSQIRKLLNRREFIQNSGLLGAGAAAQANANLAKSLLGVGDAAVPAPPGLDPRTFLPPGLQSGLSLPNGDFVVSNGSRAYAVPGYLWPNVDTPKSDKDLIVKLLQEARDAIPKMPAGGVSQYNTLTKDWHRIVMDENRNWRALKSGESMPTGMPTLSHGWQHPDMDEFTPDAYDDFGPKDYIRRIDSGTDEAIADFERHWREENLSQLRFDRSKAREAGDPKADQVHREAIHDLGLGGTARFDQPAVMQDTGEPTGLMGLPGSSQTNSHQTSANIRRMLGVGAAVTAAGGAAAQARDLQQEAGQNTVHQQSEPEFSQTGMAGDYLNHEPPTGAISGVSLREYLAPEDKERDYSPRGMYARSVLNAMSQPVIQNPSSGEYLSMSEYVKQRVRADAMQKLGDTPMTDEVSQRVWAAIEERASMAADNVGGVLAGTLRTNNQYTKDLAAQVRSEVTRHAPGGDKALLGHRTQSEENTAQQEYGSGSKHMLTADGQRNHQALAISELLNAQDTNYAPDTGLSHTARLIGSVVAPAYSMFTSPGGGGAHGWHLPRTTGEVLDEDALFRKPDGRLEYAANLYTRSRDQSSASVYTPEGRPKYGPYNMQGIDGVVAATQENQTYPMAFGYQNTTVPVSEVASNIAAPGYMNNVQALRAATKRTTPVIPDGVDPKKVQQLSQQLSGATDKLHDWPSAYYGPKKADLVNSVLGGKEMPRSYFSPAEQVLFDLPAELFDPANLVGSAIAPPLAAVRGGMGAASLGIRSMLKAGAVAGARSVPRAAVTVGDDLFQEGATSAGLLATAGDLGNAFIPKKTNSLMDDINPNTPGFDQKLERNAIDQRMRQQDAAEQYAKMTGTYVPPKPKNPMSLPPTNWLQP